MRKVILSTILASTLLFIGCGSDSNNKKGGENNSSKDENCTLPEEVTNALNSPTTQLSEKLTNTLSYMGNEERLAYDVYNNLYSKWEIKQFTNIASKSEIKHIGAVQELIKKYKLDNQANFTNIDLDELGYLNTPIEEMKAGTYDIAKIQALYDDLVALGSTSAEDALKVGCTVEVVDVTDLDEYIKIAEESNATDVTAIFNFLRDGSYNHYWAFDKALKNRGIEAGCCTWKDEDLNLCHMEYPQKEQEGKNGQGNGNGNGQGNGKN